MTTPRSELLNELEKAFTDEAYDGGMGALSEEQFAKHVHRLAEVAVETVEHAHAEERVDAFAKRLGIQLMPWQRVLAVRALKGDLLVRIGGCRAGMKTVGRVVEVVRHG